LKGSPLRKGLHDESSEEGTEVDEERVTIRSLDEKVAVGGKNFSTSPPVFAYPVRLRISY